MSTPFNRFGLRGNYCHHADGKTNFTLIGAQDLPLEVRGSRIFIQDREAGWPGNEPWPKNRRIISRCDLCGALTVYSPQYTFDYGYGAAVATNFYVGSWKVAAPKLFSWRNRVKFCWALGLPKEKRSCANVSGIMLTSLITGKETQINFAVNYRRSQTILPTPETMSKLWDAYCDGFGRYFFKILTRFHRDPLGSIISNAEGWLNSLVDSQERCAALTALANETLVNLDQVRGQINSPTIAKIRDNLRNGLANINIQVSK